METNTAASELRYWIFPAIILAIYIVFRINLIDVPMNRDEGGFAYFGQILAQGGTLYKDGFDHKPPGIWLIYAVLSYLVPFSARGLHIAVQFVNMVTLAMVGFLSYRLHRHRCTALWTMLIYAVVSSASMVEGFAASAEMFMLPPITAAFLCCVLGTQERRFMWLFLSGVFCATAFWIKQPALAVTLFLLFYLVIESRNQFGWKIVCLRGLVFISGFLLPSVALLFFFWWNGTWDEFLYWSFTHSIQYSTTIRPIDMIRNLAARITHFAAVHPFPWLAAGLLLAAFPFDRRKEFLWTSAFLASSTAASAHSPYLYSHYFVLLCPALAMAGGAGLQWLMERAKGRSFFERAMVAAAVIGIIAIPAGLDRDYYFFNSPSENNQLLFGLNPFAESAEVAAFLRKHTRPGEKILIIGSEPQILVLANRPGALRHPFLYQVVGPYHRSDEFKSQYFEDIAVHKPRYAVWAKTCTSWGQRPNVPSYSFQAFFSKLHHIMTMDYQLDSVYVPEPPYEALVPLEGKSSTDRKRILEMGSLGIYRRIDAPVTKG